ncbi:MAG: trypsin-like peptidase domain-containing protein [Clostridia bacterium]|nr:trypsin-like peptidase domain-containing protein [Clostridia bacterium]
MSIILLTSCGNAPVSQIYNERLIILSNEQNPSLIENLSPAILGVSSKTTNSANIGAGVCVAKGGIVITNSHVVHDSDNIALHLLDGTIINATIIYEDTILDFAILKSEHSLPYLPLNISDINIGEEVIAVGTPISLILKHTFTKGIVSATNRTIQISTANGEAYMQNLIQHDASLNPGNSGGPLLNTKGEIVGINTLKITAGEGIGFAIPSKSFSSILNKIIKNINISSPYLGVYGYDAEIAKFNKKSETSQGFYIEDISTNSPAYSKLSKGDIITSINGVEIKNSLDFRHELNKYNNSDSIVIECKHKQNKKKIKIKLGSRTNIF